MKSRWDFRSKRPSTSISPSCLNYGRDEVAVSLELVRRVRSRLLAESSRKEINEATLLSQAEELVARIQDALEIQRKADELVQASARDAASSTTENKHFTSTASKEALARTSPSVIDSASPASRHAVSVDRGRRLETLRRGSSRGRNDADSSAGDVGRVRASGARPTARRGNSAQELGGTDQQVRSIKQLSDALGQELQVFELLVDNVLSEVMTERLGESKQPLTSWPMQLSPPLARRRL